MRPTQQPPRLTDEQRAAREAAANSARAAAVAHLRATGAGAPDDPRTAVPRVISDNTLKLVGHKLLAASQQQADVAALALWGAAARTSSTLAGGWAEALDASSGKTYYYHAATQATSWTLPEAEGPAVAFSSTHTAAAATAVVATTAALPAGWFRATAAGGDGEYFYTSPGLTSWELPTEACAVPQASVPAPAAQVVRAAQPVSSSGGGGGGVAARSTGATGSNSLPVGRGGGAISTSFSIRGGGGRGGGSGYRGYRKPDNAGPVDPLDPTGTGGKWSDGIELASGRPTASAAAAAAVATTTGEPAKVRHYSTSAGGAAAPAAANLAGRKRTPPVLITSRYDPVVHLPQQQRGGGGGGGGGGRASSGVVAIGPSLPPNSGGGDAHKRAKM